MSKIDDDRSTAVEAKAAKPPAYLYIQIGMISNGSAQAA
jgi:hypothetical protein